MRTIRRAYERLFRGRPLREEVQSVLAEISVDFGGGCSLDKAVPLASLIREYGLKSSVDIGVYRGRSLFPQALAHKRFTGGTAFGVDPWSSEEAMEDEAPVPKEDVTRWVEETDFEGVYREVDRLRVSLGLRRHCDLVRLTSEKAADRFAREGRRFGIVHVDGNHDSEAALADAEAYLPLLEDGGFMVLDDVSWPSVSPAKSASASRLTFLFERSGPQDEQGIFDDYAVFWKGSGPEAEQRRTFLRNVAGEH